MSTMTYALNDSATMLRRNLKHMLRNPSVTVLVIGMPVLFLLLFVYVFGDTLGNGLGGPTGGRDAYVKFVTPGIIMMAVAAVTQGTAVSVAMDMSEGIIARFRTMAIARVSVLTGHVLGALIQTALAVAAVFGVAFLIGLDTRAGFVDWLAVVGLLALLGLALTWLAVAAGLVAGSVDTASTLLTPLMFLPLLGSGFVPTGSMPPGLRWFAENQPFTPVMDTLRGLLLGDPIGNDGIVAVAWCVGIAVVCYLWAKRLYNRDPSPR